ncbi:hypothetical protein [Photobacterium indicum]|uniref:Uncharacterized protein n=1 Tax=Photobacterium indicum TaxID=81447 RepID=A0A2T3L2N3_9GAMM|nr:hypothetical protein [Photobacterium indicum]PSV43133.1 hypothetical protein C9J47_23405 [Photobacterium indicum]
MALRPTVYAGRWIWVNPHDCLITRVRSASNPFGDCEVVFDPLNPTCRNVYWNDESWAFTDNEYFSTAAESVRLSRFVKELKKQIIEEEQK